LPDGAHHGSVIATSLAHGGSADCTALTGDDNAFSFHVGGDDVAWDWEPKDIADATTIRFTFTCPHCVPVETRVELPHPQSCCRGHCRTASTRLCPAT
jgi:hypothetical protein